MVDILQASFPIGFTGSGGSRIQARVTTPNVTAGATLTTYTIIDLPFASGRLRSVRMITKSDDYDLNLYRSFEDSRLGFETVNTIPLFSFTGANLTLISNDLRIPFGDFGRNKPYVFFAISIGSGVGHGIIIFSKQGELGKAGAVLWKAPLGPAIPLAVEYDINSPNDVVIRPASGATIPTPTTVGGGTDDYNITDIGSDNKFEIEYNGDDWDLSLVTNVMYVKITGFVDPNNNGVYALIDVDDANDKITVKKIDTPGTNETLVAGVSGVFYDFDPTVAVQDYIDALNQLFRDKHVNFQVEPSPGLTTELADSLNDIEVFIFSVSSKHDDIISRFPFGNWAYVVIGNVSGSGDTEEGLLDLYLEAF